MRNMGVSLGMIACACLCSAGSSSADVVTDWNARAAQAVGAATGAAARLSGTGLFDFAMVQAAMHDALQAFEHRFETYGPPIESATGSPVAAAAAAAHDVLVVLIVFVAAFMAGGAWLF